jgi:hypothetical protein
VSIDKKWSCRRVGRVKFYYVRRVGSPSIKNGHVGVSNFNPCVPLLVKNIPFSSFFLRKHGSNTFSASGPPGVLSLEALFGINGWLDRPISF